MNGKEAKSTNVVWTNVPNQDGASFGGGMIQMLPNPTPTLKLYKKLFTILKEGISVGKSGWNSFHKYNYVTESDVVTALRDAFVKNGLIYNYHIESASQVEVRYDSNVKTITRVQVRFDLVDVESGETLSRTVFGDGEDKGDKAIYKAITGAQKYFLMKTFMLATDDDPENDGVLAPPPQPPVRKSFSAPVAQTKVETKPESKTEAAPKTAPAQKEIAPKTFSTAQKPATPGFNRSAFSSAFKSGGAPTTTPKSTTTSSVVEESKDDVGF